jgi:glycosyltransferase involved in cell wall biosynthesis
MNKPLTLTIVIPVYNEERYLKSCLEAVAGQTIKPDEVIVVDNNSTDSTAKIAKRFDFVKLIREPKQGVSYSARRGFNGAKSDIIGRIDGDTILPPYWVERVKKDFAKEGVAATTGPVSYYDMPFPKTNYWIDHMMRKYTFLLAPTNPFLYGSNMAVRRSVWLAVVPEICDETDIHEDIDLAIHLYKCKFKIIYNKKLLSYASGRRYNDSFKDFFEYLKMYRRTYRRHHILTLGVYPAMFMWGLGFVLIHPWRRGWYYIYRHLNRQYPYTLEARKNPMSRT